ncbi:MAG: ribonuclease E/G [Rhodospirillales bacterium]
MSIDELVIRQRSRRAEVALLQGGRLIELRVADREHPPSLGAIHLGRVATTAPQLDAVFVDIGVTAEEGRDGFLRVSDMIGGERDRPRPGDPVLVQIAREQSVDKGARLSMKLALPGRLVVLRPQETGAEISPRIADPDERSRLGQILAPLAQETGLTARTAASEADATALTAEVQRLAVLWDRLRAQALTARPPLCLFAAEDELKQVLREHGGGLQHVVVEAGIDGKTLARQLGELAQIHGDRFAVEQHDGKTPIFEIHDIEAQLAEALAAEVPLAGGGSLSIEPTRALTAIDVDSGRAAPLAANLDAAEEIARQLRLRNIGGAVTVDFVTLKSGNERDQVLGRLAIALAADPTPAQLVGWTRLGMVELTRARRGAPLAERFAAGERIGEQA